MTLVALVPMRHDSERVPGKNRRDFNGAPLYHRIVRTLLAVDAVDQVVIDTDSPSIAEEAPQLSDRVAVLKRPDHLRGGDVPMNAILLHDVEQVPADLYLQTHSTNPLLRPETVARAVAALDDNLEHDSLFSVTRLQTRLYDATGAAMNHDPSVLLRTQDLPPVFEENSNIYLFDGDTLRKRNNRIGANPLMFEIDAEEAWDIDVELDFRVAELLHQLREVEA